MIFNLLLIILASGVLTKDLESPADSGWLSDFNYTPEVLSKYPDVKWISPILNFKGFHKYYLNDHMKHCNHNISRWVTKNPYKAYTFMKEKEGLWLEGAHKITTPLTCETGHRCTIKVTTDEDYKWKVDTSFEEDTTNHSITETISKNELVNNRIQFSVSFSGPSARYVWFNPIMIRVEGIVDINTYGTPFPQHETRSNFTTYPINLDVIKVKDGLLGSASASDKSILVKPGVRFIHAKFN